MNKKTFVNSMKYLDSFYRTFNFDFNDSIKLEVWHDSLSIIPEQDIQTVVKAYCLTNQYPPQSPHSILDVYREMTTNEITPEQAWEIVDKNLFRGINGYSTYVNGKVVYRNDFFKSIEQHPLIIETCNDILSVLRDITSDNKSYAKHEFKEVYKSKLQRNNKALLLSGDNKLKIGE